MVTAVQASTAYSSHNQKFLTITTDRSINVHKYMDKCPWINVNPAPVNPAPETLEYIIHM